ncbi:MAG: hypothetical protein JSR76_01635 [Verrucomicrobia bacterium]|nr:hypothetical protein [Verrucomicrobiota bacterium]
MKLIGSTELSIYERWQCQVLAKREGCIAAFGELIKFFDPACKLDTPFDGMTWSRKESEQHLEFAMACLGRVVEEISA